jgi:RNA polymerase sigma factor (sigma-70 family)
MGVTFAELTTARPGDAGSASVRFSQRRDGASGRGRRLATVADEDLADRFRQGDPDAVRAVYKTYGPLVFGVAFQTIGDRSLAEEATQEAFVRAWKAAATFDPGRSLAPWLATIVRRVAIDIHRREARRPHVSLDFVVEHPEAEMSVDRAVEVWDVREAVAALPPDEREVVSLQHGNGLTHVEIAERLRVPLGTVKSRSFRAHRRLAAALGRSDDGESETVGLAEP